MENKIIGKQKRLSYSLVLKAIAYFACSGLIMGMAVVVKFMISPTAVFSAHVYVYVMAAAGIILTLGTLLVYMFNSRRALVSSSKTLNAVCTAVAIAFIANVYFGMISIYAMPTAMAAFMIAPMSKRRDAFVGNLFANFLTICATLIEHIHGGEVVITAAIIMFTSGMAIGTITAYTISSKADRTSYISKGLLLGAGYVVIAYSLLACYGFPEGETWLSMLLKIMLAGFVPVFIGLIGQPIYEVAFNLVTDYRLVEFTDHNSPLIKRLRTEAPGTFTHSLAVANFAEMCASAIGENPYLARACAYYHDIGKLNNSEYYKENQADVNLHDQLLPEVSAGIIRSHTTDGMELCKKYRIPDEIAHVTVQHHGTLVIPVFYKKAQDLTDGEVDIDEYRYKGETPISKIASIIMICDASEAAIRAMDSPNGEKVDALLTGLIESRIKAGQFDNCNISMSDLTIIKQTIINAFGGQYHKRLKYPGGEK